MARCLRTIDGQHKAKLKFSTFIRRVWWSQTNLDLLMQWIVRDRAHEQAKDSQQNLADGEL